MRSRLLAGVSLAALAACAALGVRGDDGPAKVRLQLTDASTGPRSPASSGCSRPGPQPLTLAGLVDRCRGMPKGDPARRWFVVPADGAAVELPRGKATVEAVSGLETALARIELDLTRPPDMITVPLAFLFRPADHRLVAGNTHLHLRDMTPAEADDYLRRVPAADGLRVVFLSYLERAVDDARYTSNRYPTGSLDVPRSGVLFQVGEEYRHNFGPGGEGYGHVMFLNLKDRLLPASLGPGITRAGHDGTPLRPGIDAARRQGATVIWCHNTFGHEDVPSVLTGRVDALNLFDGSRRDSFEATYYKFLNVGLRLPVSTGTDWFVDDFSRDYVGVEGPLTPANWLAGLRAGRATMTNGPLLTLTVDGRGPGAVLAVDGPRKLAVEASAVGRLDFGRLELVHNGKVIDTSAAAAKDGGHRAGLNREVVLDGPGWLAARVSATARNEFGAELFAHTCPVYVDVAGRRPFDVDAALALLRMVEAAKEAIPARGTFPGPAGPAAVLAVYDEAAALLTEKIAARK